MIRIGDTIITKESRTVFQDRPTPSRKGTLFYIIEPGQEINDEQIYYWYGIGPDSKYYRGVKKPRSFRRYVLRVNYKRRNFIVVPEKGVDLFKTTMAGLGT